MNKAIIIGRTTSDIELKHTSTEKAYTRFTIAVNRRSKDDGADFINCVAWGKTAELLETYVKKGSRIGVIGRIQTGSYTNKENKKVYTTDIVVEELEFLESKNNASKEKPDAGFTEVEHDPFDDDEGLPFNKPF